MKLTKGKIARLHKTNRQSVKKQKRNKKRRNVKNLMSLNQKQTAHLANKSMKKYKKVGEELVPYVGGKSLNTIEVEQFVRQLDELIRQIEEASKNEHTYLSEIEQKYYRGLVQIFNNKLYNINTLKKICSVDVKVNMFIITDDNQYMVVAMSDGRVVICDIHLNGAFINSYSHDDSVTALVVFPTNLQSNIIISGSEDGYIKRYTLGPLAAGKRPLTQTHQVTTVNDDSEIFSIIVSQDEANILVTTVKKRDEGNMFKMAIYSSTELKLSTPTASPDISNLYGKLSPYAPYYIKISGELLDYAVNIYRHWNYKDPNPTAEVKFRKVKYITVSADKNLMAFCTDGRIHIQKLDDDGKPTIRNAVDDTGKVITDKYELDELVIESKFLDDFNIACFKPDKTHIACGAGNILSIWMLDFVNKRTTQLSMTILYSEITSICFDEDFTLFCGFGDGSIQKNPNMIDYPDRRYCWIEGHFEEVRNLYHLNDFLYSSSLDGTIRKTNLTSLDVILTSTVLINSAPELGLIEENKKPGFEFQVSDDNTFFLDDDKNALNELFETHFNDKDTMRVIDEEFKSNVRIQKGKLSTKFSTLNHIMQIDNVRKKDNTRADDLYQENVVSNANEVNRINTLRLEKKIEQSVKTSEIRKLTTELIKNQKQKEETKEMIFKKFQTDVNVITMGFRNSQRKTFKEILKTYYGLFFNLVLSCIKSAVTILNDYIIDTVNTHFHNVLSPTLLGFRKKEFDIESQIRTRTNDTMNVPFWKSITELENDDNIVILELDERSPQFEQLKRVQSQVKENKNYTKDEEVIYSTILYVYEALDNLNFKIRKYNLSNVTKGRYSSNNLGSNNILMVLCQTDILTDKSFNEIMEFAYMFDDINSKLKEIKNDNTFSEFELILDAGNYYKVLTRYKWPSFFKFYKNDFIEVPTIMNETPLDKNTLYIRTFDTPKNKEESAEDTQPVDEVVDGTPTIKINKRQETYDKGAENLLAHVERVPPVVSDSEQLLTTEILKKLTRDIQTDRQESTYSKWLNMLNSNGIKTINDLDSMEMTVINGLDRETGSNLKLGKKGLADSILEMKKNKTIERYLSGQLLVIPPNPQLPVLPPNPRLPDNVTAKSDPASVQQVNGSAVSAPYSSAPRKNLSEADLGRATKVFIDELVHKIGPVLNNMPYGAQETTDAVSTVQRIINGDSSKLLGQPSTSDERITFLESRILKLEDELHEKRQKLQEVKEDDDDDDDEDYLEEDGDEDDDDDSGDENGEGKKNKKTVNKLKDVSREVAPVANSKPKPDDVSSTTTTESSKALEEPVVDVSSELLKPVADVNSELKPVAVSKDIERVAVIKDKPSRGYLKSLIEKFRLPWVNKLRSKVDLSSGGGQKNEEEQKGGASLDDVKDINEILTCYAKRLSDLAHNSKLKRTTSEINSGIVENWYHYQAPNQRKVYVDKVTANSPDLTIDKLHKSDVSANGSYQVENILYVKFIVVNTDNHEIQQPENNGKYNFVKVTGLYSGTLTSIGRSSNQTQDKVNTFMDALKENLQKAVKITTIKFLVSQKGFIVLENDNGSTYNLTSMTGIYTNPEDDPEFRKISDYFIRELMTLFDFDLRV